MYLKVPKDVTRAALPSLKSQQELSHGENSEYRTLKIEHLKSQSTKVFIKEKGRGYNVSEV